MTYFVASVTVLEAAMWIKRECIRVRNKIFTEKWKPENEKRWEWDWRHCTWISI